MCRLREGERGRERDRVPHLKQTVRGDDVVLMTAATALRGIGRRGVVKKYLHFSAHYGYM